MQTVEYIEINIVKAVIASRHDFNNKKKCNQNLVDPENTYFLIHKYQ